MSSDRAAAATRHRSAVAAKMSRAGKNAKLDASSRRPSSTRRLMAELLGQLLSEVVCWWLIGAWNGHGPDSWYVVLGATCKVIEDVAEVPGVSGWQDMVHKARKSQLVCAELMLDAMRRHGQRCRTKVRVPRELFAPQMRRTPHDLHQRRTGLDIVAHHCTNLPSQRAEWHVALGPPCWAIARTCKVHIEFFIQRAKERLGTRCSKPVSSLLGRHT